MACCGRAIEGDVGDLGLGWEQGSPEAKLIEEPGNGRLVVVGEAPAGRSGGQVPADQVIERAGIEQAKESVELAARHADECASRRPDPAAPEDEEYQEGPRHCHDPDLVVAAVSWR